MPHCTGNTSLIPLEFILYMTYRMLLRLMRNLLLELLIHLTLIEDLKLLNLNLLMDLNINPRQTRFQTIGLTIKEEKEILRNLIKNPIIDLLKHLLLLDNTLK